MRKVPVLDQYRMKMFRDLLRDPVAKAWNSSSVTAQEMAAALCDLAATACIVASPEDALIGVEMGISQFMGQLEAQCANKGINVCFEMVDTIKEGEEDATAGNVKLH